MSQSNSKILLPVRYRRKLWPIIKTQKFGIIYLFNRILDHTSALHNKGGINEKDQQPMQGI
jgi:hypothetical protein